MTAVAKVTKAKGHKIDALRGSRDGRVSQEWYKRGDDERFTDLASIEAYTTKRSADLRETTLTKNQIKVVGSDKGLFLETPAGLLAPTHAAFGGLCYYGASPAEYLRRLPAHLAAQCLNEGLTKAEVREDFKLYHSDDKLVGLTGPKFGRVYDADVVKAVRQLAGNGTGDTDWKVPGQIDWMSSTYNSSVDIDKDTTTLYASDKDVFMFLVNDKHPIRDGENGVLRGEVTFGDGPDSSALNARIRRGNRSRLEPGNRRILAHMKEAWTHRICAYSRPMLI
jgi:hypothetical protein